MPVVENNTPNRGYPLPHASNDLVDDVARLIVAITGIDLDVANLIAAVATKAAAVHSHVIADTTGLSAALDSKQDLDEKGQANGFASLDATGKVPTSQLPSAVLGAMSYQGTWNASTNTPTIPAASAGNRGHYYKVATAGSTNVSGETDWKVGDWIVSNGAAWDKIDNTDQVTSVAGLQGAITAAALKIALAIAVADVTGAVAETRSIEAAGLATGGGNLAANRTITVTKSTNAQAVAGVDDTTAMTPVRVKESVREFSEFTKSYTSAEQAITLSGGLTLSHGLGVKPKLMVGILVCKTAQGGYSVGDEYSIFVGTFEPYGLSGLGATTDTSNIYLRYGPGNGTGCFIVPNKTTAAQTVLVPANWRLVVRAFA